MYILLDEASGKNAVVDPFDVAKLEAAAAKEGIKLGETLLLTHHHQDHSGGNDVRPPSTRRRARADGPRGLHQKVP